MTQHENHRGVWARQEDADADTLDAGASAPEPSLAARIARSGAESRLQASGRQPFEPADVGGDEERGQPLAEGSASVPSTGRVDAADGTLGRHAGEHGSFAAGEGQSSVGGAQGDLPGSGVVDQPEFDDDAPENRAGFLEGIGGRRGTATTEAEIYDDMGGDIRSIADAARDSAGEPDGRPDRT